MSALPYITMLGRHERMVEIEEVVICVLLLAQINVSMNECSMAIKSAFAFVDRNTLFVA